MVKLLVDFRRVLHFEHVGISSPSSTSSLMKKSKQLSSLQRDDDCSGTLNTTNPKKSKSLFNVWQTSFPHSPQVPERIERHARIPAHSALERTLELPHEQILHHRILHLRVPLPHLVGLLVVRQRFVDLQRLPLDARVRRIVQRIEEEAQKLLGVLLRTPAVHAMLAREGRLQFGRRHGSLARRPHLPDQLGEFVQNALILGGRPGVGALAQVVGQLAGVAEALDDGVHEAGVADVAQPAQA